MYRRAAQARPLHYTEPALTHRSDFKMRRLLMLFLAVITIAACDSDPSSFEEAIAGTYTLQTIDGDPMPLTIRNDTAVGHVQFISSEVLMGLNGVYREIDTFRTTKGTSIVTQVDTFTAVWSPGQQSNTLTLTTQTASGPFSFTGVWNGTNTLTFMVSGVPWVFRR
jgi:hypothetical protein